jgi:predicted DNA-binding antitoxin AbrB/MazE fold protein
MTIKAHFDGKVFVPDEPVDLPKGERIELDVRRPPGEQNHMTAAELARSEFAGMWRDRTDIGDSTEWARQLRRKIERREI